MSNMKGDFSHVTIRKLKGGVFLNLRFVLHLLLRCQEGKVVQAKSIKKLDEPICDSHHLEEVTRAWSNKMKYSSHILAQSHCFDQDLDFSYQFFCFLATSQCHKTYRNICFLHSHQMA